MPAAGLVVGVALAQYVYVCPLITALLAFPLIATAALTWARLKRRLFVVSLFAAAVVLGFAWCSVSLTQSESPGPSIPARGAVTGSVCRPPQVLPTAIRLMLKGCRVRFDNASEHVRGRILLNIERDQSRLHPVLEFNYNDTVQAEVLISPLPPLRNPGGFDAREYWHRRSVTLLAYCSEDEVEIIQARPDGLVSKLINYLWSWRRGFDKMLSDTCAPQRVPIMRALVLGDRSDIRSNEWERLQRLGIAHIVAISGLHIGLVAWVFYNIIKELLLALGLATRSIWAIRASSLGTIVPVLLYAAIVEPRIPAIKAVIIAVCYLLSKAIGTNRDILNHLALAAIVILLWQPTSLFSAGFQLSFVACIAVVVGLRFGFRALPMWADRISSPKPTRTKRTLARLGLALRPIVPRPRLRVPSTLTYVLGVPFASACATIATAPIVAWWFGRISLVGPFVNVLVVPVATILVNVLLFAFFALPISTQLASVLLQMADACTWLLQSATDLIGEAPRASLCVSRPSLITCALFYVALVCACSLLVRRTRKRLIATCAAAVVLMASFPIGARWGTNDGLLRATILDTGSGPSCLLECPGDKVILIDGGGSIYGTSDVGQFVLLPYLRHRDIKRIDTIVVTNPGNDHVEGLVALLSQSATNSFGAIEIGEIIVGDKNWPGRGFRQLLGWASRLNLPIKTLNSGMRAPEGLEILPIGESSLVLKIEFGSFSMLFPSEAGRVAQSLLSRYDRRLNSTVLVVPNGGRMALDERFLELVSPQAVIVSGLAPEEGNQSSTALSQFETIGCEVYRIEELHSIIVETNGKDWEVTAPLAEGDEW